MMNDRRGLTLASVVISTAITAVTLTIAVTAFYSGVRLDKQSAGFVQATNFIEGVMERTAALPYAQVKSKQITAGLPNLPEFKCAVDVNDRNPGLKEVMIRCSWRAGSLTREAKLCTYVAKGQAP
jgi:Tfp pilus assembly protein PilE